MTLDLDQQRLPVGGRISAGVVDPLLISPPAGPWQAPQMVVPAIWLDRCPPDEFVAELSRGGRLRWLVDFASAHREALHTDLILAGETKPGRRSKSTSTEALPG